GMLLAAGEIGALHVAEVGGGSAERNPDAFVVRAHADPVVAAGNLAFEVEDVGEFGACLRRLVLAAVLVEPRNGKWAVAAVEWSRRNGSGTIFRAEPAWPCGSCHGAARHGRAHTQELTTIQTLRGIATAGSFHESRLTADVQRTNQNFKSLSSRPVMPV